MISQTHGAALVVGLTMVLMGAAGSCAASPELRRSYAEEVARCISNERAIVDRRGTTQEQDEADLASERARCDEALHSIEAGR